MSCQRLARERVNEAQSWNHFRTLMKGECTREELGELSTIWKNRQTPTKKTTRKTPAKKPAKKTTSKTTKKPAAKTTIKPVARKSSKKAVQVTIMNDALIDQMENLPDETIYNIARNLSYADYVALCKSSVRFATLCKTKDFQELLMRFHPNTRKFVANYVLPGALSKSEEAITIYTDIFVNTVLRRQEKHGTVSLARIIYEKSTWPTFLGSDDIEYEVLKDLGDQIEKHNSKAFGEALTKDGIFVVDSKQWYPD
jgi:hypothetical protein